MFKLTKIQNKALLDNKRSQDDISELSLLLILVEELLNIDERKIDIEKSSYTHNSCSINLVLVSGEEVYCKIYFEIISPNVVDIQLQNGGEYLFMQEILNNDDKHKFRQAVRDLLTSPVTEQIVYSKKNIASVSYSILHKIGEKTIKQNYSSSFKTIWPWEKKEIVNKEYKSWI